jgi:riboflavin transporter
MSVSESIERGISSDKIRVLIFAILLALLIIMPFLIHLQWLTGPTVNAALFIATVILGPGRAILLGLMPSTVALSAGLLPFALAPMVPFIMLGNVIMILIFHFLYKKNYFLGLSVAAFLKFAFLHQTVTWLMSRFLANKLVATLSVMMSWPQFVTAIIGGLAAYAFLKQIKKV